MHRIVGGLGLCALLAGCSVSHPESLELDGRKFDQVRVDNLLGSKVVTYTLPGTVPEVCPYTFGIYEVGQSIEAAHDFVIAALHNGAREVIHVSVLDPGVACKVYIDSRGYKVINSHLAKACGSKTCVIAYARHLPKWPTLEEAKKLCNETGDIDAKLVELHDDLYD